MDSDLETPRHEMDFNDTNMSHSLEMGKYHQDDPYLQVTVILFDKFYGLLRWQSQSKNGLIFPNFVYIFPDIMKKVFIFSQM